MDTLRRAPRHEVFVTELAPLVGVESENDLIRVLRMIITNLCEESLYCLSCLALRAEERHVKQRGLDAQP